MLIFITKLLKAKTAKLDLGNHRDRVSCPTYTVLLPPLLMVFFTIILGKRSKQLRKNYKKQLKLVQHSEKHNEIACKTVYTT